MRHPWKSHVHTRHNVAAILVSGIALVPRTARPESPRAKERYEEAVKQRTGPVQRLSSCKLRLDRIRLWAPPLPRTRAGKPTVGSQTRNNHRANCKPHNRLRPPSTLQLNLKNLRSDLRLDRHGWMLSERETPGQPDGSQKGRIQHCIPEKQSAKRKRRRTTTRNKRSSTSSAQPSNPSA